MVLQQAPLSRGVRQGDPLSPYLFIIALETLTIKIRNDDSIKGFKIGGETTKLSLFADDMTCFVRDKESLMLPPLIFWNPLDHALVCV